MPDALPVTIAVWSENSPLEVAPQITVVARTKPAHGLSTYTTTASRSPHLIGFWTYQHDRAMTVLAARDVCRMTGV